MFPRGRLPSLSYPNSHILSCATLDRSLPFSEPVCLAGKCPSPKPQPTRGSRGNSTGKQPPVSLAFTLDTHFSPW